MKNQDLWVILKQFKGPDDVVTIKDAAKALSEYGLNPREAIVRGHEIGVIAPARSFRIRLTSYGKDVWRRSKEGGAF